MDSNIKILLDNVFYSKKYQKEHERIKNAIIWRYGLDGNKPMTYDQVAAKLPNAWLQYKPPVTRERARQIIEKGLRMLRRPIFKAKDFSKYMSHHFYRGILGEHPDCSIHKI